MATSTYVALATTTLSSSATEVTFSSIPSSYRDLVLVIAGSSSTASGLEAKINGSTSGMSTVYFYGDGSSAASGTSGSVAVVGQIDTGGGVSTTHFLDYSATDKFKPFITRGNRAGGITITYVNQYASLSAITSIAMTMQAGSLNSGTVISLYGIEA